MNSLFDKKQRKQATLQWLLDLCYIHDNNLNDINKLLDIQDQKQGTDER